MSSATADRPNALALAIATACVAAAAAGPARAASGAGGIDDTTLTQAAALAQAAHAPQTLYLDIVLDGQVVRPLVRFHRVDGRLRVEPEELRLAGLELPPDLALDADGRVALDRIAGLEVTYDQRLQRVILRPDARLRPLQQLGYRRPGPVQARRDHGLILDWDAYARSFDGRHNLSLGSGARWFGRWGTLEVSGVSRFGDGEDDAWSRLDTTWSYSDPDRMQTWAAGDLISGGVGWSRPVRMAGVQWRRNFGVRPDLITYPVPQFSAAATLPSAVELYVNNVRQSSTQVAPGPFVLSDFPRIVGAGQALVVITDALGRTTQTSVPLYVDYQRLAPGLTDFSVEVGVLRRGFGVDSADYGDDPVASASWRRGLSDQFTLELHGEAGPDLGLAGAGLAWSPLARYGVVTGSFARSDGDAGSGHQYALGYQWFGQEMGFDVYAQRASADYRDLGSLGVGRPPLREQDRASVWWQIPRGSLSLSWLRFRDHDRLDGRTVSLGLSQNFDAVALSASVFDDSRAGRGLSLSLTVPLDDRTHASVNGNHRDDRSELIAGLRRNAPYAGGWGWEARASDDGDGQLSARYRGGGGEFWFGADRIAGSIGGFAQGYGSVVLMDGELFASRRIHDAFAVVSTNGVADVPILYENRVAGRTDNEGYLLLADLRGWQDNRIAIDPDQLAAAYQVPKIERLVTPANAVGVRVLFDIQPIRAAIVLLRDDAGAPVAAGTRVQRADGSQAIVGFGGELWLENYVDGETLRWDRADAHCTATAPPLPAGTSLPRLGPVQCNTGETP